MSERCPDCHTPVGQPHSDGCDVARCTLCGHQRISCDHGNDEGGWGQIWTGEWPGDADVQRLGLKDLNELGSMAQFGLLTWDQNTQRWERTV